MDLDENGLERVAPDEPAITVVVPSLNQGRFIRRTIDSILTQNVRSVEIIVVDGGSCDETVEILKSYGRAISWTSGPDRGQSDAINRGFERATGDIVCFLNSDDYFVPGALRLVSDHFVERPECLWVFGRCHIVDENDAPIRGFVEGYKHLWSRYARSKQSLFVLNYIPQPATFWRASLGKKVGPIDESLYYSMDYDLWLRFSKHSQPEYIDEYLSNFRIHGSSKSLNGAKKQLDEAKHLAFRHGAGALATIHHLHDLLTLVIYRSLYGQPVSKHRAT